ncbi:MAG: threonine/serine exporter family protein [Bacteroidota bacterium]
MPNHKIASLDNVTRNHAKMGEYNAKPSEPDPEGARVDLYLKLGMMLYEAGASVHRTIDSVRYCAQTFGDNDIHVFVNYEDMEVSRRDGNYTHLRMHALSSPFKINAAVLHKISRLLTSSRESCDSSGIVISKLQAISKQPPVAPKLLTTLSVGVACGAFTLMNHGDLSALWIVPIASSLGFATKISAIVRTGNLYLAVLLSTIVTAGVAFGLLKLAGSATPETAIISSILFLVPGSILINGGLDIIRNHTVCGIARVTSVLIQMLIITGVLLVPLSLLSMATGAQAVAPSAWTAIFISVVASGIATLGFSLMMNIPRVALLGTIVIGGFARAILDVAVLYHFDPILSVVVAMTLATLLAFIMGRMTRVTEVVIAVVVAIPMVPGIASINGIKGLFHLAHASALPDAVLVQTTLQNSLFAVSVVLALVASIIFPIIILSLGKPRV